MRGLQKVLTLSFFSMRLPTASGKGGARSPAGASGVGDPGVGQPQVRTHVRDQGTRSRAVPQQVMAAAVVHCWGNPRLVDHTALREGSEASVPSGSKRKTQPGVASYLSLPVVRFFSTLDMLFRCGYVHAAGVDVLMLVSPVRARQPSLEHVRSARARKPRHDNLSL